MVSGLQTAEIAGAAAVVAVAAIAAALMSAASSAFEASVAGISRKTASINRRYHGVSACRLIQQQHGHNASSSQTRRFADDAQNPA